MYIAKFLENYILDSSDIGCRNSEAFTLEFLENEEMFTLYFVYSDTLRSCVFKPTSREF